MSNFAALIDVLSLAGSRLSDGTANASGRVWFFQPGTNNPVNAYSDAAATTIITQPVTLTSGGLVNRTDFPEGIYVTQPVRLYVEDVNANTVVDTTYIPATAGDVGINNVATTATTLDQWITDAQLSAGGTDFNYLESSGATARPVQDKFREIAVSVKDFGAVGDGIAIDTVAIQAAMNRVKALGGGVVYVPPGTYLVDQALTMTSATSVRIIGAGYSSRITTSHATANLFTLTSCSECSVERVRLTASTSTGAAIATSSCVDQYIDQVFSTGGFGYTIDDSGTSNFTCTGSLLTGSARAVRINRVTSAGPTFIVNNQINATTNLEMNGGTALVNIVGTNFIAGTTGILFNATLTGTGFIIANCPNLGALATPLSIGTATLPVYRQWGNGIDAVSFSAAIGNTLNPVLYKGDEVLLSATSGGAGTQTVAAPTILPGTSTSDVNLYWNFVFKNASAGAVTWSLNAVFVVSAAIPTTDAHTIGVRFRWDRATSKLREVSRADTVT
jgi:Pectate lyase superfamily protein